MEIIERKKKTYLSYKDIEKCVKKNDLQYLILIGQRSNGKSYASKELALRNAFSKGEQFTYLRRRKEDLQEYMIIEYFADMLEPIHRNGCNKIQDITQNEYDTIAVYRKGIYFAKTGENDKVERGIQVGYAHALSGLEGIKSRQFPKVTMILFEEFIATGLYLWDEPTLLQNYTSTIFRDRKGCVIMIGNTISRIVPYFTEWMLDNVPKQPQSSLEVYNFKTGETETRIGVFLCGSLQSNSGMFFGSAAKMIVGGEWDRAEQPKLARPLEEYETLYRMVFKFSEQAMFLMSFIWLKADHSTRLWYVEPKTTQIRPGTRVICPEMHEDLLWTRDFKPLTNKENTLFLYYEMGKIAFSDNLTGTEFNRCVAQMGKRKK